MNERVCFRYRAETPSAGLYSWLPRAARACLGRLEALARSPPPSPPPPLRPTYTYKLESRKEQGKQARALETVKVDASV